MRPAQGWQRAGGGSTQWDELSHLVRLSPGFQAVNPFSLPILRQIKLAFIMRFLRRVGVYIFPENHPGDLAAAQRPPARSVAPRPPAPLQPGAGTLLAVFATPRVTAAHKSRRLDSPLTNKSALKLSFKNIRPEERAGRRRAAGRLAGSSPTPRRAQTRPEETRTAPRQALLPLPGSGCAAPGLPPRGDRLETAGTGEEKARGSGKAAGRAWGAGERSGGGGRAMRKGRGSGKRQDRDPGWGLPWRWNPARQEEKRKRRRRGNAPPARSGTGRDPRPGPVPAGPCNPPALGAVRPGPLTSPAAAVVGRGCDVEKRGLLPPRSPASSPGRGARVLPPGPPYFSGQFRLDHSRKKITTRRALPHPRERRAWSFVVTRDCLDLRKFFPYINYSGISLSSQLFTVLRLC